MIINYCERYLKLLRARQDVFKHTLTSGAIKNHEHYQKICGTLKGLEEAESLATTLYKDMFDIKPAERGDYGSR